MSQFCSQVMDQREGCLSYYCSEASKVCATGNECMLCLRNYIMCGCLNVFCCHCSCIVFPGSSQLPPMYDNEERKYLSFENKKKQSVPFIELASNQSWENSNRHTKIKLVVYFHGNSENVCQALQMAYPIFKKIQIPIFLIQYPTYGSYVASKTYDIAEQIKANSLEFCEMLSQKYRVDKKSICVIGRSIGSGPACHLATAIKSDKLVLISPFDSISSVAREKLNCFQCFGCIECFGCMSTIFHDHFDNSKEMKKYNGNLMVIHGKSDEVISIENGNNLVRAYEKKGGKSNLKQCKFIQPPNMTHNRYEKSDITEPIYSFINHHQSN